jgi:hypothetical protein
MHRILLCVAFGWLTAGGVLHFVIDVVSQYVRRKRPPGRETSLYYGLNTAYALGQALFGALGLWLAWRAIDLLGERPVVALSLAGAAGWLAIGFLFIEYREPKFVAAMFAVLVIAAAMTA